MLAVTFLFPTILAAAGAAAAPVIIHLILRTRPRKIVFPAMRFVRKTHQANLSKLRLKHLVLLLMRMLAIGLLAALIARAQWPRWTSVAETHVPAAVVVVVDNSASMAYVHRGTTLLARGKRFAQQVLDSLPAGSRVAVLPTDGAAAKVGFQADRKFIAEQLAAVQPGFGSRPIGPSLTRALAMLEQADLARKEIYVVSDMTEQSWRDLKALPDKPVSLVVLSCGCGEDANLSLGAPRLASSSMPAGAEAAVETVLRGAQVGGEIEVRLELDGRAVAGESVVLQPAAAAAVTLALRPERLGVAHGRVFFRQSDPLAVDNTRYFTLNVGPPARALVVRDPATIGRGDLTSFLMGHALAPPAAGGGPAPWLARETVLADRLDAARLAGARIVVLADVSSLAEAQWKALEGFARGGGGVWVVIGSLVSAASYNSPAAQRLLPAAVGEMELLASPAAWRAGARGEPMLDPFAAEDNPPLSEVQCHRRLRLASAAPDAHVVLRYADEKPAILLRTVGAGSAVLWNFSPAPEFSNLAGLAQFPILAQRTARLLATDAAEGTLYLWGQTATVLVPRSMNAARATVRRPGGRLAEPVPCAPRQQAVSFLCDRLGHWTVQFAEGDRRVERGFSVNADPAESDRTPADGDALRKLLPAGDVLIASSMDDLAERRRTVSQPLDLAVPILLALLVLMTAESFFANRFYRHEPPGPPAA